VNPNEYGLGFPNLQALASFLPVFQAPGFMFGHWTRPDPKPNGAMVFPHYDLSPPVTAFIDACYRFNWVRTDFDWVEWSRSDEHTSLRTPDGLEDATPDQLARVLTVCIRQDRFGEGSLASDYDTGLLLRILKRAHQLAIESEGGATPS
jgi:hypothetical protein